MGNAGLRDGVPRILDDLEVSFRPHLLQLPGIDKRCADIIAAMDDHAGNVSDPVDVAQKLVIGIEETAILEIVAFNTCKRDGVLIFAKGVDTIRVRQNRNDRAFPTCPAPRCFKAGPVGCDQSDACNKRQSYRRVLLPVYAPDKPQSGPEIECSRRWNTSSQLRNGGS